MKRETDIENKTIRCLKIFKKKMLPNKLIITTNYWPKQRIMVPHHRRGGRGGCGSGGGAGSSCSATTAFLLSTLAPTNLFRILILVIIGCPGLNNGKCNLLEYFMNERNENSRDEYVVPSIHTNTHAEVFASSEM